MTARTERRRSSGVGHSGAGQQVASDAADTGDHHVEEPDGGEQRERSRHVGRGGPRVGEDENDGPDRDEVAPPNSE